MVTTQTSVKHMASTVAEFISEGVRHHCLSACSMPALSLDRGFLNLLVFSSGHLLNDPISCCRGNSDLGLVLVAYFGFGGLSSSVSLTNGFSTQGIFWSRRYAERI